MVRLHQITESQLGAVTEEAKKHLPNSVVVYGCLACGFHFESFDASKTKIFVPDAPLPFFVIITGTLQMGCQNMSLYWNLEAISNEMVKQLLETLPDWNWKEDFFVYGLDKKIAPLFDEMILGDGGLGTNHSKEKLSDDSYSFSLNPDDLPDLPSLGEDFYLSDVPKEVAKRVHENWMYNFLTTPADVSRMIEKLPTSAIYSNEDTHKPVSWVLTKHQGEAGFTYTFPDYRQKGLAIAAVVDLIKKNLKNGYCPYVFVDNSNTPSICFHEKIGYKKASIVEWAKYSQK